MRRRALACLGTDAGAGSAAGSESGPAAPVQAPGSAQRSSFANPAEYDSYMAALNTKDPARKAQAMEVFIAWYPGSILRLEAHEQAISAWQAANQPAKADVLVAACSRSIPTICARSPTAPMSDG